MIYYKFFVVQTSDQSRTCPDRSTPVRSGLFDNTRFGRPVSVLVSGPWGHEQAIKTVWRYRADVWSENRRPDIVLIGSNLTATAANYSVPLNLISFSYKNEPYK